jgi:MYXO-CTERM domain-containing protein
MNCKMLSMCAAAALVAGQAAAAPISFTATGNAGARVATATFATSGTSLVVTLTNATGVDALIPDQILTGLFFDVTGPALSLTPQSAALNAGSVVLFGGTDPAGVVGGEWAYLGALTGAPHGADYGISSTGLDDIFGAANFPGSNLQGPVGTDGLQYGITTAGDNSATGNAAVTGSHALIQNSVIFTLSGLPANFDPSASISNVSFQYGTSASQPNDNVPTPGSLALLSIAGLTGLRRRRR